MFCKCQSLIIVHLSYNMLGFFPLSFPHSSYGFVVICVISLHLLVMEVTKADSASHSLQRCWWSEFRCVIQYPKSVILHHNNWLWVIYVSLSLCWCVHGKPTCGWFLERPARIEAGALPFMFKINTLVDEYHRDQSVCVKAMGHSFLPSWPERLHLSSLSYIQVHV